MTASTLLSRALLIAALVDPILALAIPPGLRADTIIPDSALLLERVSRRRGRRIEHDSIEAELIRAGRFRPREGDTALATDGSEVSWKRVELDESGGIRDRGLRGGYLYVPINSESRNVMVLVAAGQSLTYFNGEIRGGDVYSYGYSRLPVVVEAGKNDLLFRVSRGRVRVKLHDPDAPVFLSTGDPTLPDLVVGEPTDMWGAIIVVNASEAPVDGLSIVSRGDGLSETTTEIAPLAPLSQQKLPFRLRGGAAKAAGKATMILELRKGADALHSIELELRCREPFDALKRTFVSRIDGSVQYFGLRRARPSSPDLVPAIVLSCHGASVEAIGQAAAYAPKSWLHLVAPTNRRPYGFDWEDWGRADAMEVLDIAKRTLRHDASRIYLTGHSMGGHGSWHLAVTHPSAFAAVGPSAGWLSYWSYGRSQNRPEPASPLEALLRRSTNTSDTISLSSNLKQLGVYILHGGADNNVPASQARRMAEVLEEFHHDWSYHEEPGKGHWWGNDFNDGGSACVDWPEMFDQFARHALPPPGSIRHVEFTTANPGVASRCHWVSIEAQLRQLEFSKVDLHTWPNQRRFTGTTDNVAALRLDVSQFLTPGPISLELDGQTLEAIPFPETGALWLARAGDRWIRSEPRLPSQRGPHRYGSIKNALECRPVLVYGTRGTDEENRWSFAKARFDAETFWYRGNASLPLVSDVDFERGLFQDRSIVVYGNADTNAAWKRLLEGSPVDVSRGKVVVGSRTFEGDDLAAIFMRPRLGSEVASVVAVGGSGLVGMRSADRDSFFYPFIRYPDCTIRRAVGHETGRPRLLAAGYFGLDWSLEAGEFAWDETE